MEKSYVSMEQKVCAICGNIHDSGAILLHRRLHKNLDPKTLTGYDHCEDCLTKLKDSYIAFVEVSNGTEHSTMKNENAIRTGKIIWLKKHIATQIFNCDIKTPMSFCQSDVSSYLESLIPST